MNALSKCLFSNKKSQKIRALDWIINFILNFYVFDIGVYKDLKFDW